jgi:hypothetical protein
VVGDHSFTISTKLRAPFTRLAAARVPHFSERLPATIASFTEKFAALFLGELHADAPKTDDFGAVKTALGPLIGSATCEPAGKGVFGTLIARHTWSA